MKKPLLYLSACWLLSLAHPLTAADHHVKDKVVFVGVEEASAQFGWEPKLEGDTLVLCRDQLCVPVDLSNVEHVKKDSKLFIDADTLGKIMNFTHEQTGSEITLKAGRDAETEESSSYHSSWPEGRGFEEGQTLPDIPLIDLEGNEVRFGDFLGKRYLIYGWASW